MFMDRPTRFRNVAATAPREFTVIPAILDDLSRTISLLACDIAAEEERTGIHDPADPNYSMLARNLRARLVNLKATATSLALRLALLHATGHPMAA
jgi:hypothetical protein